MSAGHWTCKRERSARDAALEGNRHGGGLEAVGICQVEVVRVGLVVAQRALDLDGRSFGVILAWRHARNAGEVDVLVVRRFTDRGAPDGGAAVEHPDAVPRERRPDREDLLLGGGVVELPAALLGGREMDRRRWRTSTGFPPGSSPPTGPNSSRRSSASTMARASSPLMRSLLHALRSVPDFDDGDETVRGPGEPDVEQRSKPREWSLVEVGHHDRRCLQALVRVDGAVLQLPGAGGWPSAGCRIWRSQGSVVVAAVEPSRSGLRTTISFSS